MKRQNLAFEGWREEEGQEREQGSKGQPSSRGSTSLEATRGGAVGGHAKVIENLLSRKPAAGDAPGPRQDMCRELGAVHRGEHRTDRISSAPLRHASTERPQA